jgi:hypothetical protein
MYACVIGQSIRGWWLAEVSFEKFPVIPVAS